MEFVATIFGKVLDVMVEPVKRQLDYLCNYGSNVQELGDRVRELQDQRHSMRVRVQEAERNGENIHNQVTAWLTRTDEKIAEFEVFQNDEGQLTTGCSNGSCPNLKLRHNLGRKAKKMIPQCDDLLRQSNITSISYCPEPEASDVALYDNGYVPFKSRDVIVEEVMNAMRDPAIKMIGIYGQGGVGKTTLAKAVARKAKAEKLFNVVVMANITSTPDIKKIQGEMADMLGLRLDNVSEWGNAGRLQQRLKKEKENTLIILDDLWAGLDLTMLGIRLKDDDDTNQITTEDMPNISQYKFKDNKMASDSQRCKILLTSRHKEVLASEMEVKDAVFTVNVMEEEESEKLFDKVVGITDEDFELKSLSTKIVHKCANLPLAILAAGKALKKNKNKVSWENELQRLEKQEMTEVFEPVEFSTMLSYNHLQSEELKSIFLLCARLGKDPSLTYLARYCVGLGIFQEASTIKEVQDRTHESIKTLKDSSLLLDTNSPDCATMHDAVRDAALSIASKQKNVFTRRYARLDEWPEKDAFEKYSVISLHYCDITDGIPEGINCPELKVLHIDCKDPSMEIPDKLFEGMKELRVLIMTGIDLSSFPSSINGLVKLRMLCLEQCVLGDNIAIIGELKNLRVLSLLGSKFELLPSELRQLGRLQLFDISSCTKLKVIPSSVISELNSLQELYMGKTSIQWGVTGKPNHNEIATLDELTYLQQLSSLDIHIQDITVLPSSLYFDKLDSYKIVIGDSKMPFLKDIHMPYQYKTSRVLALHLKKGSDIHSQVGIKMLFKSIDQLFLGEVDGLHNATYELNVEGFPSLEHLTIRNNSDVRIIIYSTKWEHQVTVFPKLESMCLYKLESLEKLCNCQLTDTSFRNLRTLKIKLCGQLKYIFSFSMARLLTELRTLEVSECDSLGDIVVAERRENNIGNDDAEDDRISFPQLRYLMLQSLLELTCFYPDDKMTISTFTDYNPPLFNEKVSIPNLESLELSSMNIKKVWGAQPLPNPCFQNLTKLNVNNCGGLRYLFSLSMVGNLMKLQSLFGSECDMMKDIFDPEDIRANEAIQELDVFPQLKNIKIIKMEQLKTIWHAQASKNSFSSLESVIIEGCHKLVTLFPSYMVGRYNNLGTLEVHDSKSVEEIFAFPSTTQKGIGNETNLRGVSLHGLPKLKHIWNKDPQGLLNFEMLQYVFVDRCLCIESLFPLSFATSLMKLEILKIWECDGMKEIVAGGDASSRSNFTFKFPKLTTLALVCLPELRCFYPGMHAIEFQVLTHLSFGLCGKLEAFDIETTYSEVKPVLSSLVKVISNLEELRIHGLREMKWLQDTIGSNIYVMHKMKQFAFGFFNGTEILFWFLHRFPNLESLNLQYSFKEVFPDRSHVTHEKIGTVVQLKNMSLWRTDIPLDIGFEDGAILHRIERLCIVNCFHSTNLIPSSLSLTHLSYLEVSRCNKLRNLLTLSTAKSLVQLAFIKVVQCEMMEEIVIVEENEEEKDEIVFGKLKSLELVSLRNLTSFCNCSSKLVFRFPSLEKVKVSNCLKLEKFSEKIWTPKLEKVDIVEEGEGKWYWEGDLNSTIQKIFTDQVLLELCENLKLSCHPELQHFWEGEILPADNCFNNLRTLIVNNCSFLSEVFPSRLLPYFKNLEELQVSLCPVEIIFGMGGSNEVTKTNKGKFFGLKRMTLEDLNNLKCIWSENPQSTISFQNLKEMVVTRCSGIKTLFPAFLARNLMRFEKLEIGLCDALEEIVGKEEDGGSIKFEFYYLTSLRMYDLPNLKFFYPGRHTLEFPSLERLHVSNCDKLDTFALDSQSHQGFEDVANNITTRRQSLFIAEKVILNLEELALNGKDMTMLSQGHFPDKLLHKLKFLGLCFGDSHGAGAGLPFKFFHKVPNLESLRIRDFNELEEMFPSQSPEDDVDHIMNILAQVRELYLESLPLLSSVGLHNSWMDSVAKTLRVMQIRRCPRLTILVPSSSSSVSFYNLKELVIIRCQGLVSLFSSSVAKSLVQLHTLVIIECGSLTNIVNHGIDESALNEITFERLKKLHLSRLPSLMSFYSGNATLEFSNLSKPIIEQCPKMKCFSQGVVRAPNYVAIMQTFGVGYGYDRHNYGDLNATIEKLFDEKQFTRSVQKLKLVDYLELEGIWHGVISVPGVGFSKLRTLIVDGCQFLSHYVIPFHLLGLFINLEVLQVQDCDSVKAIFEVGSLSSNFSIPLKSLTLKQLPSLENVWNDDPQEFVSFKSLQYVDVLGCQILRNIFPASMSQCKLESLEILKVGACERLVEIVSNDETVLLKGATSNSIVFPSLTMLFLLELPKLKCIYPGLEDLEWPKLKVFHAYHCDQLRIFPTKGTGHDTTDVETLVSFQIKGFPNLEELSLNKADIVNIDWRAKCDAIKLIQRVKFLKLHCFHEDSDGFTWELFQMGSLPNLEKLRVACGNFKEMFSSHRPDVDLDNDIMLFPQLQGLELHYLWNIESIGSENKSWAASILDKNLETLSVRRCRRLRSLAPSSLSFSKLRELHVEDCEGLEYLLTLSTASGLVLLEKLSVARCASIQEIVLRDGSNYEEDDITFSNLKELFLESLGRLSCFHSGNSAVNLPSLDSVVVHECPRMRIFCRGAINASQHVTVSTKPPVKVKSRGLGLNASIELIFSSQLANLARDASYLWLSDHPELQGIWDGVTQVPAKGFTNLKYLTVDGTQFLSYYVIPFHLLLSMRNLEDLRVRDCDSVKAIFEVGPISSTTSPYSFPLKKMILEELPNLEQVWNFKNMLITASSFERLSFLSTLETLEVTRCPCLINLAPSTVSFSNLRSLEVSDCDDLEYLFTSSTAKSLALLEDLSVWKCKSIHEIVAKGDDESDEEDEITFGNLKRLYLLSLPSLDSFYNGTYHLKFPCLEEVEIYSCSQMKVFSHAHIYTRDNVIMDSDDYLIEDMIVKAFKKCITKAERTLKPLLLS